MSGAGGSEEEDDVVLVPVASPPHDTVGVASRRWRQQIVRDKNEGGVAADGDKDSGNDVAAHRNRWASNEMEVKRERSILKETPRWGLI